MITFDDAAASVERRGFFKIAPGLTSDPRVMAQFVRAVEEKGELARALRKYDGSVEAYDNLCQEMADLVITCASLAHVLGIDLDQAVERKLAADEKRGHLHEEVI